MRDYLKDPREIELKSMEIIEELLGGRTFPAGNEKIIKRVIHTTADFDFADITVISPGALQGAQKALSKGGCRIVADTQMIVSGVNKSILASLGGADRVLCRK